MEAHLPYGRAWIGPADLEAVCRVLNTDWLTTGPNVQKFEQALAEKTGARYAVAVSNGTAALHLACLAAGIGPGDQAITSPITFVASMNCALYCGAKPDFADIDPSTYNLSPDRLRARLTAGAAARLIVPVHFAGQPCDVEAVRRMAPEAVIIEDACHALGASWQDSTGEWRTVGSCLHSDMSVFSFHPVKHITTGEGGAITTNDSTLYKRLIELRSHGISRSGSGEQWDDGWYYEMDSLGYNYRITDFQCALGSSQLSSLDAWVARRRDIASAYNELLARFSQVTRPTERAGARSSYHLYVVQTPNRKEVFRRLREQGIGVQVHYIPVHLQPYYRRTFGFTPGDFPCAEQYYARAISLPIFPRMTDEDVTRVVRAVGQALAEL